MWNMEHIAGLAAIKTQYPDYELSHESVKHRVSLENGQYTITIAPCNPK
jgi:hypothetical protein